MEKLINYLNEFGDINRNKAMVEHQDTYIISKKFGFIEWLVDNDKIDYFSTKQYLYYLKPGEYETMTFDMYECVLIQLAISDNPIQDLIGILKNV